MAYFNIEHYKLLNKLKGALYHEIDADQQRVYETRQAYDVTKQGAEALQQLGIKNGWTKRVGKVTAWSVRWATYNRTRIYPEQIFYKGLACAVGIDAALGFKVKFSLIDTQGGEPALRMDDARIRGVFTPCPIVPVKSIPDCKAMDFAGIMECSANAIH